MPTDNSQPATGEPMTNANRAARVAGYLVDYMDLAGMTADELDCGISDLITDLMHLIRGKGFDVEGMIERARGQFNTEVVEFYDY